MTKVLIVDNSTVHIPKLVKLLESKISNPKITIEVADNMQPEHVAQADLVVLSGGTGRSVDKNPKIFNRLAAIIEDISKPAIGICLGAEALAVYYGAKLQEMPVRRVGNVPVQLKEHGDFSSIKQPAMVYEFHKWLIKDAPSVLSVEATSKDGIEIFAHTSLPIVGFQFHPEVRRKNNQGHLLFEQALQKVGIELN